MKVGYARISTAEQSMALQEDALKNAGCEKIYKDVASGVKTDRPGLEEALSYVRDGDTLVVWKLDRLGRSIQNLITTVNDLNSKGIEFKSLQESLDTTTSNGKLIFHIFSAFAEFERNLISERTNAGLAAARARGRFGGRPFALNDNQVQQMMLLYDSKKMPIKEICKLFKISDVSLYSYKKRFEAKADNKAA